jgi:paraquat-inducible protein A
MQNSQTSSHHILCRVCSNTISLSENTRCERCGESNHRLKIRSTLATLVFSLTALIFFIPALWYPFMTIELYSNTNSSTIWEGVVSLIQDGSWPIGLIVFLASIVIPILKLIILFYLGLTARNSSHPRFKTRLYHIIEAIGRWSMLDIFLMAILVAILKLGNWTSVKPEMGSYLFLLVVIFTMLASASFDPKLLWNEEYGNTNSTEN